MDRRTIEIGVLLTLVGLGGTMLAESAFLKIVGSIALGGSVVGLAYLWWRASRPAFRIVRVAVQPHLKAPKDFLVGEIEKTAKGPTRDVRIELVSLALQAGDSWTELLIPGYPVTLSRMGEDGYRPSPIRSNPARFGFLVFHRDQKRLGVQWQENYSSVKERLSALAVGKYVAKINVSDDAHSVTTTVPFTWAGDLKTLSFGPLVHEGQ